MQVPTIARRCLPEGRRGGDTDRPDERAYRHASSSGSEARRAVRHVIQAQADAIRRKDADAVMACNAPGIRSFGIVAPLRRPDAAAIRERLEYWFAAFAGPLDCEVHEPDISTIGDTACARFLQRFSGINMRGMAVELWVRVTMGLHRIDGRWLVAHEHLSDPLDHDAAPAQSKL
ncbi:YybH family protein [Rhodanobacter umsongensis]|uniref:YybH family protein n=1 Tax=Rhodanobacter umsongensis TaxID=633153 RepID=A0ABW0JLV1_9GAMM